MFRDFFVTHHNDEDESVGNAADGHPPKPKSEAHPRKQSRTSLSEMVAKAFEDHPTMKLYVDPAEELD